MHIWCGCFEDRREKKEQIAKCEKEQMYKKVNRKNLFNGKHKQRKISAIIYK